MSPTPTPIDLVSVSSSGGHYAPVRKLASANKPPIMAPFLAEKIQPLVLASPEEQTDNWDDDFEDGISLTKLQGNLHLIIIYVLFQIVFLQLSIR